MEKLEKIMKKLALVSSIIVLLLCAFDFFSSKDYEHYDYELTKVNKMVIGGEDITELISADLIDDSLSSDYKKTSIDLGTKTIARNRAGLTAKYFYTMAGDEIVIKNKSFYHVDGLELPLPDGLELYDVEQAFYKRDSRIEYACSMSVFVEGTLMFVDVSTFYKK